MLWRPHPKPCLTNPAKRNIIPSIRGSRRPVADINRNPGRLQIEMVAGFLFEIPAGFVGIRMRTPQGRPWSAMQVRAVIRRAASL